MRRHFTPSAARGIHPYEHQPGSEASELASALAQASDEDVV